MTSLKDTNEEKGLLKTINIPRHYGSTSINMKKPDHIVVHPVSKFDTIQGIALKYGVTIESIKHHNKLWLTGSMFLYDCLQIPLSQQAYILLCKNNPSLISSISNSNTEENLVYCDEANGTDSTNSSRSSLSSSTVSTLPKRPTSSCSTTSSFYDCSEKSHMDILSKIDSNIAEMKSSIAKMDQVLPNERTLKIDQMELDDSNQSTPNKKSISNSNSHHPSCWNNTDPPTSSKNSFLNQEPYQGYMKRSSQNGYQNMHNSYTNSTNTNPTSGYQKSFQNSSTQPIQNASQDLTSPPTTIFMNPRKRISASLKKLLRDHDELYEV